MNVVNNSTIDNLLSKVKGRLASGVFIGKQTKEDVKNAISTLKNQVADCRKQLERAQIECDATKEKSDKSIQETRFENNRLEKRAHEAALKADETEKAFANEIKSLKEGSITVEELDIIKTQLTNMIQTNEEEVEACRNIKIQLETANKTLLQKNNDMEAKYVEMLSQAFDAIDKALTTIDVDELLQKGGFQSSSSGVTDFKKYRTSSRSYNIKELRKKKKESRKKEKERKKGSRKKERRSKKRRKD